MRIPQAPLRDRIAELNGYTNRSWAIWFRQVLDFIRPKLTTATTFYVRPDGNDHNSGLVDKPQGAFLTLQRAIEVYESLDTNGHDVTIQIADGEYTAGILLTDQLGGGSLTIQSNTESPASCVLNASEGHCIEVRGFPACSPVSIRGLKLEAPAGSAIKVSGGSVVGYSAVEFGACLLQHVHADSGAAVTPNGDYLISGGAESHWLFERFGCMPLPVPDAITVTLSDSPAFSEAFARALAIGYIRTDQIFTFDGSATGKRYVCEGNSIIETDGAAADYLPGGDAGTTADQGLYI